MDFYEHWNKVNDFLERKKIAAYIDVCNPLRAVFREGAQVGIDIGAYGLKLVALRELPRSIVIEGFGYREIPRSIESGVSILDTMIVQKELKTLVKECKIRSRHVALTISDPAIIAQQITVPRLSETELMKAIRWRAEKHIAFPLEEAVVDFQNLGLSTGHASDQMDVVMVVAHKGTIGKYITMLKELKLVPSKIDITPFAFINAFLKTNTIEHEKMVALIDIGSRRSTLAVVKGRTLLFLRVIETAGHSFTEAIKNGLKLGWDEAEALKKGQSVTVSGKGSKVGELNIFAHIEPSLMQLVGEINRSFAYCEAEILVDRIERAFIFGGGGLFQGLDEFLAAKLGIPVEVGNFCNNVMVKTKKRDKAPMTDIAPCLASAFGAALL